jgi:hypothetical protein
MQNAEAWSSQRNYTKKMAIGKQKYPTKSQERHSRRTWQDFGVTVLAITGLFARSRTVNCSLWSWHSVTAGTFTNSQHSCLVFFPPNRSACSKPNKERETKNTLQSPIYKSFFLLLRANSAAAPMRINSAADGSGTAVS